MPTNKDKKLFCCVINYICGQVYKLLTVCCKVQLSNSINFFHTFATKISVLFLHEAWCDTDDVTLQDGGRLKEGLLLSYWFSVWQGNYHHTLEKGREQWTLIHLLSFLATHSKFTTGGWNVKSDNSRLYIVNMLLYSNAHMLREKSKVWRRFHL